MDIEHTNRARMGRSSNGPDHDRQYTADELEFLKAIDRYKRVNRRPFPHWSEVLQVFKGLGYRKPESPP